MSRLLLYINRRSGVAHVDRACEAIASVPARYLRLELHDESRPRRRCSRCWGSDARPRSSALAALAVPVTERSEGNPRSGLTGGDGAADSATERAGDGESPQPLGEVGSSNTRPSDRSVTDWLDDAFENLSDLRFVRERGYVVNIKTGEILSSVIADVRRERNE